MGLGREIQDPGRGGSAGKGRAVRRDGTGGVDRTWTVGWFTP